MEYYGLVGQGPWQEVLVRREPRGDGLEPSDAGYRGMRFVSQEPTAVGDFPIQPSQKDGLGRMCKPHWNEYTNALRKAAVARKAAEAGEVAPETAETAPAAEPKTTPRVRRAKATPTEVVTG